MDSDSTPGHADALVVLSSFPAIEKAREAVRTLVLENLAACGTVFPGATSIYQWHGKLEESSEAIVLLKTRRSRYPVFESRLRELHPHEVPEILAIEVAAGLPTYLDWLTAQTRESR